VPGGQPDLLEHDRHHRGLCGRADRKPLGVGLHYDRRIPVRLADLDLRQEHMPRHR
jgi:hypothetical protein